MIIKSSITDKAVVVAIAVGLRFTDIWHRWISDCFSIWVKLVSWAKYIDSLSMLYNLIEFETSVYITKWTTYLFMISESWVYSQRFKSDFRSSIMMTIIIKINIDDKG